MSLFVSVPGRDGRPSYDLNPNYNLRFLMPAVIRTMLEGLRRERWEPWYEGYLRQHGITEAQLVQGHACLASYLSACLEGLGQHEPIDALKQCGFWQLPLPVKLVLQAKIGQLVLSTAWAYLRECTRYGDMPIDVAALERVGRELQEALMSKGGN